MLTFEERVLCGNPLQRFGSGLEPDPEPTREFGPVANTTWEHLESLLESVSQAGWEVCHREQMGASLIACPGVYLGTS